MTSYLHRPGAPARIAGLDLSTARIGLATPSGELVSLVPKTKADDPGRRLAEIRDLVDRALRAYPPRPDLVVLEGYSLGSPNRSTLLTLGEVGGAVRCRLFELDIPYVVVPPSSVKRFATGHGNADKYRMIQAAIDLGARGSVNDDEADAFHLRRMGRAAHGLEFGLLVAPGVRGSHFVGGAISYPVVLAAFGEECVAGISRLGTVRRAA